MMIENLIFVLAFFLFFLLVFLWKKVFDLQKELKKEEKTFESFYEKLLERIEKEIEFLDGQPGLSEEEKKLRDKLFEIVKSTKEKFSKKSENGKAE